MDEIIGEVGDLEYSELSSLVLNCCFKLKKDDFVESVMNRTAFCDNRFSLRKSELPSCQLIQSTFNEVLQRHTEEALPQYQRLFLDLPAECDDFDWDSNINSNTDFVSPIFRPCNPESPITINFDRGQAIIGLGLISESELKVMVQEMDEKFTHLSDLLVSDLEKRDRLITEINIKNKFISAMLRVQSLRHSNSLASGYVLDTIARHKLRTKTSEDKVNGKFLSSIIPYCPPENNDWSIKNLRSLTDILVAIYDDKDNVPMLVSNYLQTEVLQELKEVDDIQS